jgi:hypothetical protein
MNDFKVKEVKEEKVKEPVPAAPKSPKKENKIGKSISTVVTGNFLTREEIVQQLPFILFLMGLALVYIANTYYAERTLRDINTVTNQIKELRSEYITSKSDLMFISKQSEVAKACEPLGVKESLVPPVKLEVADTTKTTHKD